MSQNKISRRTILKSALFTLQLPLMESLLGPRAFANPFPRLLVVNFPNGCGTLWAPSGSGSNYSFGDSSVDNVLAPYKNDILAFKDLRRKGGGGPAHVSASVGFLTASSITGGASTPRVGSVSMDQFASAALQGNSTYRSVNLGPAPYPGGDPVDTGYSTAYNTTISWATTTQPAPHYTSPSKAFSDILANATTGPGTGPDPRLVRQNSILDYLDDQIQQVQRTVSTADKIKLDQYLTSVRDLEKQNLAQMNNSGGGGNCSSTMPPNQGQFNHDRHTNQMLDMIPMMFACDQTRTIVYQIDYEFGNKDFTFLIPERNQALHHNMTHNQNVDPFINRIGLWHFQKFARLLNSLKSTPDPMGGTLLDNTIVLFGCGMNARNGGHSNNNIPFCLAGGGAGTLSPGRLVDAGGQTHDTVLRSLLQKFGHNLNATPFSGGTTTFGGI